MVGSLVAVGVWTTVGSPQAQAAAGCTATYTVEDKAESLFEASVRITNNDADVDAWTVGWTFADGQKVTQAWNSKERGLLGATNAVEFHSSPNT